MMEPLSSSSSSESPCELKKRQLKKKRVRRPRKAFYVVRKEEMLALQQQAEELRKELALLQHEKAERDAVDEMTKETRLTQVFHQQRLGLVRLSSMLGDHHIQQDNPLFLPIRLPADADTRKRMLLACCDEKVAEAQRFIAERFRLMDITKPYLSVEVSETEDVARISTVLDVTHFSNVTVREVHEAVTNFFSDLELHLWDFRGQVTMREDDDEVFSDDVMQRRLVSATDLDCLLESNLVMFRRFFKGPDECFSDDHGVMAMQWVESDDLYPYVPSERVRKDWTGAVVVTRIPPTEDEDEPQVVMLRWFILRVHGDPSVVTKDVRRKFREKLHPMGRLLLLSVREHLTRWETEKIAHPAT